MIHEVIDDRFNRSLYLCDTEESLREIIETVAGRDWYDWMEDSLGKEGSGVNVHCSYVIEIFNKGRETTDVVMYLNFDKYAKRKYTPLYVIRTLVHECVHASDAILDGAGLDISRENEEARAYQTDWIFGEVMEFALQHHKKAVTLTGKTT